MSQYVFGSGQLFGIDSNGAPVRFGALQDVSVDFSGDLKQLYGQYQFPVALGRGKSKIEIKASYGQLDVGSYNALYFGQSAGVTTGKVSQALNEAGPIGGECEVEDSSGNRWLFTFTLEGDSEGSAP